MVIALAMSLVGAAMAAPPIAAADPDCARVLQLRRPGATARAVEATDLIETLDIGSNGGMEDDPVFTLSPDQSRLAVAVRRADTASNSYCSGIYIVSKKGQASLIDAGRDVAFWQYDNFHGTHGFPSGVTKVITPRWSPDGQRVAFLKLVEDRLQLWLWDVQRLSRVVTAADDDIVDFRFTTDGNGLVYKKREDGPSKAELKEESLRGYHLDDRYFPFDSTVPYPRGAGAYSFHEVDLGGGATRPATEREIATFSAAAPAGRSDGGRTTDVGTDGNGTRRVRTVTGTRELFCSGDGCTDVEGQPWFTPSGRIRYLRREGWSRSATAIYEWKGGQEKPARLFQTNDILTGCQAVGDDVVCAREGSTRPRSIDRIDLRDGTSRSLFEPNPDFRSLTMGKVERLQWTNAMGVPSFGDLVYPPAFQPGHRYPLIVTQYESRGFLRGGTGDEYPIQLFARAGYLVLSIQRPPSPFPVQGLSLIERQRRDNEGFLARRSILSTIETKVSALIEGGLVDAGRVGITGLSDGSTTTQYAALHSSLFKAASVSNCCWEPSQTWLLGTAIQHYHERGGWPASPEEGSDMWSQISLSRNAGRVAFPILIQAADREFKPSLEAVRALRAAKVPVDVYVFPDERHIKRHPAHRLNIYRRNLRWFDFWLLDRLPPEGEDRQETKRWADMKRDWREAR
jgi:dipeptidyl aminopeptidase/acylaminoacyl peptidase